jgi:hypothetical protein
MIINIINPEALKDWLQEMAVGDDDIAVWLQKAFTKALKKREESAVPLREWPENPPAWMKPDGTYHEFQPDTELTQKVSHIKDWLKAARQQEPAFIETLYPMDLASAFNKAEKFFAKQNQKNRDIIENDADTKTIVRFENGMRIAQLTSLDALKYEGTQMGHCVGSGGYDEDFTNGSKIFYSLRDAKNEPHATMEVIVEGNILRQCKGKQNEPPVEKYMPMLQEFLSAQKFKLEETPAYCGFMQLANGQYYSINNLLDGLSLDGDPGLIFCINLKRLPNNLSVGGDFILNYCTGLTQLPHNLSVDGNLSLTGCNNLAQLPDSLFVDGSLNLSGCTNLKSIPRTIKCKRKIYTVLGSFKTVADAANAFDAKYRPRSSTSLPVP